MCDQHTKRAATRDLNFLGIDLSGRAIGYASGISTRWGFSDKCVFQLGDCSSSLQWVQDHYAGPVVLVVINFPTPYHIRNVIDGTDNRDALFDSEDAVNTALQGNAQLSDSLESFMCNAELFNSITRLFNKRKCSSIKPCLFLQSNVEDVAVTMKKTIDKIKGLKNAARFKLPDNMAHAKSLVSDIFSCTSEEEKYTHQQHWVTLDQLRFATNVTAGGGRLSQRLQLWLDYLDRCRDSTYQDAVTAMIRGRACGVGWLPESPLSYGARTESEVHCEFESKPVHRILFVFNCDDQL